MVTSVSEMTLPFGVFRTELSGQPGHAHPYRVFTGITEADQHRPQRIKETLFFRTESIFSPGALPFPDIERVQGHMHAQAELPRDRIFHQTDL